MSSWNQAFLSILLATIFTNVSCTLFSTTTGASTITGFEVDVDIGTTTTTLTVRVAQSQFQVWHGIGFGSISTTNTMTNTYALIAEFNAVSFDLDYSIWQLGRNDGGGSPSKRYVGDPIDAIASLWTQESINTGSDPIIITLTRANTVGNGEHNFSPSDPDLQMIHAYGSGQAFAEANGHGTNRVTDTYNPITSSPTTTMPTTIAPTAAIPTTAAPTTNMPTTNQPTTNQPTTTMPTTNTPTTTIPTTNTPTTIPTTSVPTEVNATTGVPTTSTPTTQTTMIYTTSIPTTNTPTTTAPTTSIPTTNTPTTTAPTTSEPTIVPSITTNTPTTSAPTLPTTLNPTQLPTYIPTLIPTSLPTLIPTMEPTTHEPTIPITTQEAIIPTKKKYKSGVQGMIEKGEDWVNNDATQVELFMVCGIFGAMLIFCLCCWYCGQYQKTRKLRKKLIPQEQKEARNNKNKSKKYEDVPEAEIMEPESSQHNNSEVLGIAMAAGDNSIPPPPKDTHNIPIEIENKLEESLSVNESIPAAELIPSAPPPPSEPVPQDILNKHRERAATQLKKKKGIELQKLQRINSTSNVSEKSITISDGIGDNNNVSDAIIPLANKRNNNDPALALLSSDDVIAIAKHDKKNDNIKEKKRDDIALEMITITPAKNDNEQPVLNDIEAEFKALASKMDDKDDDDGDILQEVNKTKLGQEQKQDKKAEIDPFASLDMSSNPLDSLFDNKVTPEVIEKKEDKDKDSEAMGVLGGLLSANPEFGDKDNIFGGTGDTAADAILNSGAASNMIDLQKYTNIKDTIPVDYDKLTKISDTDVYKVVSVQETVIVDDGDGNVQQIVDKKDVGDELQELDDILKDNNVNEDNVKIIDEETVNSNKHDAALMLLVSGDNDKKEDDPFADLDVASPMDNMMKTDMEVVVDKKEDDPFAELNTGSPMDDIMNAANETDVVVDDKKEDDLFADLNTGSPMDNIMNAANEDDDSTDSSSDAEDDMNMMKQDNKYNTMVINIGNNLMGDNDDNVESKQEDENDNDNEDDNEESMGSEIIHDTPRHSEIVHEKLDPEVFGNGDDSSSDSDDYSNGTDPNAY